VFGKFKRKKAEKPQDQIEKTDERMALTKVETAAKMIKSAEQNSDAAPLNEASQALKIARDFFGLENTPIEICMVQVALGDMFFKLGREESNKAIIAQAKTAYRTAITMASVQGDEALRMDLRAKVKLVESLLGQSPKTSSLFHAA